jgi:hypothetical protein
MANERNGIDGTPDGDKCGETAPRNICLNG